MRGSSVTFRSKLTHVTFGELWPLNPQEPVKGQREMLNHSVDSRANTAESVGA